MSISSSMNAGVAGLRANSTRLATISDNIANASTFGYRRAQTDFHSMVVGNGLSGNATYSAGGVRTTTFRLVDQGGGLISTQNPTDLAIAGRGFLPVTTQMGAALNDGSAPLLLATTGSFRMDAQGVLRNPAGHALLGWPVDPDGTMPVVARDNPGSLRPVRVEANQQMTVPTSLVRLAATLPASATAAGATGQPALLSVDFFNPVGLAGQLEFEFTPQTDPLVATNAWSLTIRDTASGDTLATYDLSFSAAAGTGGRLAAVTRTSATGTDHDAATGRVTVDVGGQSIDIDLGVLGSPDGLIQRGTSFSPIGVEQDGFSSGNLIGLQVDAAGNLDAIFDQGFRRTLFRIPVVDVPNPNGLTSMNDQAFQVSRASGPLLLWDAGTGPVGQIMGSALQESATDIAAELTSLIQTQRAYSSNAKVIQTVDEMFQETTNIKR
jgi:flagellar hook protein FlgE